MPASPRSKRRHLRWAPIALIALALLVGSIGLVVTQRFSAGPSAVGATQPATCTDAYKLTGLQPSQLKTARAACLNQALKFSGEVVGHVSQAYVVNATNPDPASLCVEPKRWDGYPVADLAMAIGGKAYRLRIAIPGSSEHQSTSVANLQSVVELTTMKGPSNDWNQAAGTVSVDPNGVSGSIDARLVRDEAGGRTLTISGRWACGTPAPQPVFDASVPCANFYAMAPPPVAGAGRPGPCVRQDLTLSGAITGHLDYAIADYNPAIGNYGGNFCALFGPGSYDATIKFSLGDESFYLDLSAMASPSVGPGAYQAQSTHISPGVQLEIGHVYSQNQSLFVPDPYVFWLGSSGSFSIAADMKSGTIDAVLQGIGLHSDSTVQITGDWRCAA